MTTDDALIEKREELKRRLAAGEYKALVDMILGWVDHLLQRATRRTKPLHLWIVTIVLWVILQLIRFAGIYIAGDLPTFLIVTNALGFGLIYGVLFSVLADLLFIIIMVVINKYIHGIFDLWQEHILDITESVESLKEFDDWINKSCNWRATLFISLIDFLGAGVYGLWTTGKALNVHIGYGLIFSTSITSVITGIILYQFLMVILISIKLHRYKMTLFAADPSNSEIISLLSGELGFFIYFVAVFASILTLATSWLDLLSSFGIILIIFYWFPIIIMFILNQTSLSSIIRRAKWKTLNEIQAQIEGLRLAGNLKDKETIEAINRLMDIHDRVKVTRNSAIDTRTVINFINSLLLPLFAFLLGNLDKVLLLFSNKP